MGGDEVRHYIAKLDRGMVRLAAACGAIRYLP